MFELVILSWPGEICRKLERGTLVANLLHVMKVIVCNRDVPKILFRPSVLTSFPVRESKEP